MRRPVRLGLLSVLVSLLGGCAFSTPLRGPGVTGGRVADTGSTAPVVVVLTEADVEPSQRSLFTAQIKAVLATLDRQPGYLGGAVRRELFGPAGWTMTIWRSGADVDAFYASPEHRTAMRQGAPALRAFRSRRLTLPTTEVPLSWDDVRKRLAEIPFTQAR